MRRALSGFVLVLLAAASLADVAVPAIAYHDIVPARNGDPYAITVEEFGQQMRYLRDRGYEPVSLHRLEEARRGRAVLPPKPVLLTFDDGYRSYREHAFPLLQRYGFPSVVSIVTSWIDRRTVPDYTDAPIMSWEDLREVARSPLVEVLSHTDDLHHHVRVGAYGALRPAAVARLYDAEKAAYESDAAHARRVAADLRRSAARIKAELGRSPDGIAWPYGAYEGALIDAAAALGMRYHLTLDTEPTRLAALPRVNRETFRDYRRLADFGDMLTFRYHRRHQWRVIEVDLAPIAASAPRERAETIAELARRAELLRADAVVLRPFTADGGKAYFHNRAVAVAADVLGEVAHYLEYRAGLSDLYLSIPATANPRACVDLARLHGFTGLAIEGARDAAAIDRVAQVFRRYKPALKLGVRAPRAPDGASIDFVLIDVPASLPRAALVRHVEGANGAAPRALFLLQREREVSDAQLARAMGWLRAAGVPHYGYGPDDYLNDRPAALAIVRSFTEHTVGH